MKIMLLAGAIALLFVGGAAGLVWTLIVLSGLRIAVSVAMLVVLPRRDRTETT